MVPYAAVSEGPGGYVDLPDPAHQSASLQEIRANDMPREELEWQLSCDPLLSNNNWHLWSTYYARNTVLAHDAAPPTVT